MARGGRSHPEATVEGGCDVQQQPTGWGAPPQVPNQPPPTWVPPIPGPAPGVNYASPGARLVAYIVDGICMFVVFILLTIVLGALVATGSGTGRGTAVLLYLLVVFIVSIAYFPWFWSHGGATPGMQMLHIRVVREQDGGPVSGGSAILRLIGYWINSIVFYIGFIWILIDSHRQGWHDKIAGTVVIEG